MGLTVQGLGLKAVGFGHHGVLWTLGDFLPRLRTTGKGTLRYFRGASLALPNARKCIVSTSIISFPETNVI